MRCNNRIPVPHSNGIGETHCMRLPEHTGECSPHKDAGQPDTTDIDMLRSLLAKSRKERANRKANHVPVPPPE